MSPVTLEHFHHFNALVESGLSLSGAAEIVNQSTLPELEAAVRQRYEINDDLGNYNPGDWHQKGFPVRHQPLPDRGPADDLDLLDEKNDQRWEKVLLGDIIAQAYERLEVIHLFLIACPSITSRKGLNSTDVVEVMPNSKKNHYVEKILEVITVLTDCGIQVQLHLFISNIQPIFLRLIQEFEQVETLVETLCATEEIYELMGPFLLTFLSRLGTLQIATPLVSDHKPTINDILLTSQQKIIAALTPRLPAGCELDESNGFNDHLALLGTNAETTERVDLPDNFSPEAVSMVLRMRHIITLMSALNLDWDENPETGVEFETQFLLALYALDMIHSVIALADEIRETSDEVDPVLLFHSIQKNQFQNLLMRAAHYLVNQGESAAPISLRTM